MELLDKTTENGGIRINKYLSQAGVLSRRKADEALMNGEITINGRTAVPGDKVLLNDKICYRGKEVSVSTKKKVILAYNKPLGLVCTSKEADKDSLFRKLDYPEMLYYVGRLDKNSYGLLLLTNDGELANQIQKARNNHEKEYVVKVNKPITKSFVEGLIKGVPLEERTTKPCKIIRVRTEEGYDRYTFRIIITEGINHQIRRMCEYFDYKVVSLKRIRVMNIRLGNLALGQYRELTEQEEATLRRLTKG